MTELEKALKIANFVLQKCADPDAPIAVLSRQLIRQHEAVLRFYKGEDAV